MPLLIRILLIKLHAKLGGKGVDGVHDVGQLVLVLHPRLFLQEEIKLDGQTCACGFELSHHKRHVRVYGVER